VRSDFARLLLVDDVLAGYALLGQPDADGGDGAVRYLLHPRDRTTGVRYSLLAMIHAILEGLFDAAQMRHHLRLIDEHLTGPDGARLFDRPLPYHGGSQRHFQRAESASFFGREIGLMYMHAHLRYAQALAHVGDAERFFHALCQANPIGLSEIVPTASLRPSNCYYSSSDAAFADRYQASAEYERVQRGTIDLEGGWRVYSSGAGILYALVVRHLFGLRLESDALLIDPVLPAALDGLRVDVTLSGRDLAIVYRVRGAGCGVSALQLDGRPLAFVVEPNPYRRGAARVSLHDLVAAPASARDGQLVVDVGETSAAA
jgi:cellobiose phosphorylase